MPELQRLLQDPAAEDTWRNVVGTLGAIGTERAKDVLITYLFSDPDGQLSPAAYIAKSDVPVALGWLVHKSDDREALELLINATDGDWWMAQGIDWSTPIHRNREDLIASLVTKAIIGLTLSGTEEAEIRLAQLQGQLDPSARAAVLSRGERAIMTELTWLGCGRERYIGVARPGSGAAERRRPLSRSTGPGIAGGSGGRPRALLRRVSVPHGNRPAGGSARNDSAAALRGSRSRRMWVELLGATGRPSATGAPPLQAISEARLQVRAAVQVQRAIGDDHLERRAHVRLEQMAAVRGAVRLAHHHMGMQLRLAVVQGDVANESEDLTCSSIGMRASFSSQSK